MGKCISKINKEDPFLVYEEKMKNEILLLKGKARIVLEMSTKWGTYMRSHSITKFSEIVTLAPLKIGFWWRHL